MIKWGFHLVVILSNGHSGENIFKNKLFDVLKLKICFDTYKRYTHTQRVERQRELNCLYAVTQNQLWLGSEWALCCQKQLLSILHRKPLSDCSTDLRDLNPQSVTVRVRQGSYYIRSAFVVYSGSALDVAKCTWYVKTKASN